jgi:hypothetical protein
MPRTFAYVRVSTVGQTTEDQVLDILSAGFKVDPRRVVSETISGGIATRQRRGLTGSSTGWSPTTCWSSPNSTDLAGTPWTSP